MLFDGLPRSLFVYSREQHNEYMTPYVAKFIGVNREEARGKTYKQLMAEVQANPTDQGLTLAIAGQIYEEPLTPTIFNGELRGWRSGIYWPIRNERGQTLSVAYLGQRMEEFHELNEKVYRQAMILEAIKDAIVVVDLNYKITDWNAAAEALYGYTAQEALGQSVNELLRSSTTSKEREQSREAVRTTGLWSGRSTRYSKAGRKIVVETHATPLRNVDNKVIGYVGLSYEITSQVAMEEALRLCEVRYRSLFENAMEGIFRCTMDGYFTEANPALIDLLGYDSTIELLAIKLPALVCALIQFNSPQTINVVDVQWQKKER